MSKYDALIAAVRSYSATTTIPGMAHIMGNMAEFLAALAEDAAQQTEKNLKLQRQLLWLTWVLAALTAALVAFFHTLPATTQENGLWVVTTHPSAYSTAEREKLRALIALCQQQKIAVSTCRGSELSSGWKRGEVPTGWNAPSDAP